MIHTDNYQHALTIAHCIKRYQDSLTQLHAVGKHIQDMQNTERTYVKQLSDSPEETLSNASQFYKQIEIDVDYDIAVRLKNFLHTELVTIQTRIIELNLQNEQLEPIVNAFFKAIKEPERYNYDVAKVVQDDLHQALLDSRTKSVV